MSEAPYSIDYNEILHRAEIKLAKRKGDLREIRHGVPLYSEPDKVLHDPYVALTKLRQIAVDLATVEAEITQARVEKEHTGDYSDIACIREICGIGIALEVVKPHEL